MWVFCTRNFPNPTRVSHWRKSRERWTTLSKPTFPCSKNGSVQLETAISKSKSPKAPTFNRTLAWGWSRSCGLVGDGPSSSVGTWHSPLLTQPAFALETLNTVLSFVGVTALHEIIASFGKSDDLSYAYLMCWGLFLGQCVEGGWNPPKRTADPSVLLSAYLWFVSDRPRKLTYRVRENYILHNPVRMTLSAIVSGLCKLR